MLGVGIFILLSLELLHVKMTRTWGVQVPLAIDRLLFTSYYLIWDPPTQYHITNTQCTVNNNKHSYLLPRPRRPVSWL